MSEDLPVIRPPHVTRERWHQMAPKMRAVLARQYYATLKPETRTMLLKKHRLLPSRAAP